MQNKKKLIYLIGIIVMAAAIFVSVIVWAATRNRPEPKEVSPVVSIRPDRQVVYREGSGLVETEKTISVQVIKDGLRDMGFLVTEEYFFTELINYSSVKKLFKSIDLKITETNYLASYDGVVSAGVDFTKIEVDMDEEAKTIQVTIPKAMIYSTAIDEDSFELLSEKNGLGNPVSAADFNNSLTELKSNANEKAVSRGTLERADENAKNIISNFISSLVDTDEYAVSYVSR